MTPEGVVAHILLTPSQQAWFMMDSDGVPHVSLALHPGHQAKELGGVLKRALAQTDWHPTPLPQVYLSPTSRTYCICKFDCNCALRSTAH